MARSAAGILGNRMGVEIAVIRLETRGFPAGKIQVLNERLQSNYAGLPSPRCGEFEVVQAQGLGRIGATGLESEAYRHGLRHGRAVVLATSPAGKVDGAFNFKELMARNHVLPARYSKNDIFPRWA